MADIARLAGVNVSTVSRALSGSSLANEETRARIVDIAASLNYKVNAAGQSLRSGLTRTVGVIIPMDPSLASQVSDPFFLSLLGGIADALSEKGYDMLVSRVHVDELESVGQMRDTRRADGIIIVGQWRRHEQLNRIASQGIPLVVWGAKLPYQKYPTVGTDNTLGGELAVGHLLDQGARHILFLGDIEMPEFRQRHEGYFLAHAKRGLLVDPSLIRSISFASGGVQQEIDRLLASGARFDGVFAASDIAAMTAIASLSRAGVDVPKDVMVAGYDDIDPASYTHPSLTTVRQPIQAAGQQLVASLLAQIAGQGAASVVLPTELMVRESTTRAIAPLPSAPKRASRSRKTP